ncbi:MAG: type II toxin-antitoxin system VapC family toxin [Xanthomonadaceae bacterium]|nr:type II toxin-antitoxin system VapC family toxin [Xanthomonadaceae bacterium]MDP2184376.1 type II toxin-antitoxin system VapC family toxin [Xanthomonadales bacterium]MDZ4116851.1 type II toxin-antitoxin system VapC family toxin [Xanthomonadaceae bacterium]MDZ4378601.1 type II toxin-antitoxin system VapC family toxin [Xanthomonadaceae bacterium]
MAAEYLLDTNILSAALRGEPQVLLNRLARMAPSRLHLSSIVLAELQTGAEKSARKSALLAAVRDLTAEMPLAGFDANAAIAYGRIRAAMERKGTCIGPMDLLIAAQAVSMGLVLITDNLSEFKRVPGLQCENWLR